MIYDSKIIRSQSISILWIEKRIRARVLTLLELRVELLLPQQWWTILKAFKEFVWLFSKLRMRGIWSELGVFVCI